MLSFHRNKAFGHLVNARDGYFALRRNFFECIHD